MGLSRGLLAACFMVSHWGRFMESQRQPTKAGGEDEGSRQSMPLRLAAFIRLRRGEILREWEAAVRDLPGTRTLERPALLDHVPELLETIVEMAEDAIDGGPQRPLPRHIAERHAIQRLGE